MTGKPDIAEDTETVREEAPAGSPVGAPDSARPAEQKLERAVPAGDPEAPVGPASAEPETGTELQNGAEQETGTEQENGTEQQARTGQETGTGQEPDTEQDTGDGEHDLEELTAKAEKADQYLELAQRTKADFENYRKRAVREAAAAQERGVAKLAKELLPAVDNLDRALEAAQAARGAGRDGEDGAAGHDNDGTATLVSGIKLVHADVIAALARAGIERFSPEGERFDPQQHEAIAQQPVEGAESGTVVEVYQRGYRLGDVVIRPARVVVAA